MIKFTLEQVSEFKKCMDDPVHFINNYTTFDDIDKGCTNIKLTENQEKVILSYNEIAL